MASADDRSPRTYGTPASTCNGLRGRMGDTTIRRLIRSRVLPWAYLLLLLGHWVRLTEPAVCTTPTYSIGTSASSLGTALTAITGELSLQPDVSH